MCTFGRGDGHTLERRLVALRVTPDRPRDLGALTHALGGAGRPAGVRTATADGVALDVEIDTTVTPLSTIVALIDAEVGGIGRRIEPVVPLADVDLVELAGALLGAPDLDRLRLIETHLDAFVEKTHLDAFAEKTRERP